MVFGVLVRQELVGDTKAGWFSKTALFIAELPSTLNRLLKGDALEDRFPSVAGFNGDPNSNESYLLLSRYDGNLKEGLVELIDLTNFKVLHTWNPDIDAINNSVEQINEFKNLNRDQIIQGFFCAIHNLLRMEDYCIKCFLLSRKLILVQI